MKTNSQRVLGRVATLGVLRPRDLDTLGISRATLSRMAERGLLEHTSRGLYRLPEGKVTEHHALAEVSKRAPHVVVCLLSALQFHGLTTQAPFEVWVAIDVKARRPRIEHPTLRVVRFSGDALALGVERHDVEGVTVQITSPAKTVADCFKYRNKIGIDVAIEALRDYRRRRLPIDELSKAAKVCRMTRVIRPYLEATVA
jgi:predicted transcriptional regulator of viral defense system